MYTFDLVSLSHSLQKEMLIKRNSKVEKKSSELKMNFDGILEENHFSRLEYFLFNIIYFPQNVSRQTSEHFEEMLEVLSEELKEVKNSKEDLLLQDKLSEEENQELWKEATRLKEAKEKIMLKDSEINQKSDFLQSQFNKLNEEKYKIREKMTELDKIYQQIRSEFDSLTEARNKLRTTR